MAERRVTDSASASPLVPEMLVNGIYQLVRQIGAGGMGEVWEARHVRTKGRVALKLLLTDMGRFEEALARFQREVEITSGINHPNIVRVSDADKLPDGRPYLVMELLEGHDLSSVAAAGKPLALALAIEIVEQVAMGLQAAHERGIVHRDLKPANIFVIPLPGTARVLIKILDFGISKALDAMNPLTKTFSVMGTPYYMAPEQAKGGASALDARADQFSLAAIAYELLSARIAFEGDGMVNVIYKVVNEPPPSFASLGVVVPDGVEAVILRGMSKSPEDRFGSVQELSDALKRAAQGQALAPAPRLEPARLTAPSAPSVIETQRPGGRSRTIVGVGIAAAVVAVALLLVLSRRAPPSPVPPATVAAPAAVVAPPTTPPVVPAPPAEPAVTAPKPAPAAAAAHPASRQRSKASAGNRAKSTGRRGGGASSPAEPLNDEL
jgi:eukaryotic-like serine/threonine-protein kinase